MNLKIYIMLSYVNKPTGTFIDYLSCVYRDCNAVTIGQFYDMFSHVNKPTGAFIDYLS